MCWALSSQRQPIRVKWNGGLACIVSVIEIEDTVCPCVVCLKKDRDKKGRKHNLWMCVLARVEMLLAPFIVIVTKNTLLLTREWKPSIWYKMWTLEKIIIHLKVQKLNLKDDKAPKTSRVSIFLCKLWHVHFLHLFATKVTQVSHVETSLYRDWKWGWLERFHHLCKLGVQTSKSEPHRNSFSSKDFSLFTFSYSNFVFD